MMKTPIAVALLLAFPVPAIAQDASEWASPRPVELEAPAETSGSERGPRVRFGVSFGWSPVAKVQDPGSSRDDEGVLGFGGHLRLGLQLTDRFAAYYQASGFIANTLKVCVSTPSLSWGPDASGRKPLDPSGCTNYWVPVHASSLVFETTLGHRLQLGLGPSLLYGLFGDQAIGSSPIGGGALGRINAVFAHSQRGSMRQSFSIGLQAQAGFFPGNGRFLSLEVVVGYELF